MANLLELLIWASSNFFWGGGVGQISQVKTWKEGSVVEEGVSGCSCLEQAVFLSEVKKLEQG